MDIPLIGFNDASLSRAQYSSGVTQGVGEGDVAVRANRYTGDSIQFDPSVETANSGEQSATIVTIGDEVLSKFGNGAATVSDASTGGTLSVAKGADGKQHVYGLKDGDAERTDLGLASDPETKKKALAGGYVADGAQGQQEFNDVLQVAAGGLDQSRTVQNHLGEFGLGELPSGEADVAGLKDLFAMLQDASSEGAEASALPVYQPQQSQTWQTAQPGQTGQAGQTDQSGLDNVVALLQSLASSGAYNAGGSSGSGTTPGIADDGVITTKELAQVITSALIDALVPDAQTANPNQASATGGQSASF